MQLQHRSFQGLGLSHGISQQAQSIETLRFLHRFLEIQFSLLERPDSHTGLGGFGDPAGRAGDVLDPVQFRLIPQNLAQILLLGFRQLGQLSYQRSHRPGRQQILLGALADLLWQQRAGGRSEFVGQPPHLLAGDVLPFIRRFRDHQLNLRSRLGRFHKGALGELIDARFLQNPLAEHGLRRFRQLDQSVGTGFADLPLPQPLEKAGTTTLATAFFPVTHRLENAATPDLRLQIKAIAHRPGLLQPGQELHRADVIAVRIRQIQLQRGRVRHNRAGQGRCTGQRDDIL